MDVIRKDATIVNKDDAFPGTFEVILSAPTKDRDGDTLLPGEWKQPLPDHITFDQDHMMSVAGTVGSGVPRIDGSTGNLIVAGTYSSLPRAQEVRTLVNEGHIKTTSVAFMTEKTHKDGVTAVTRELLNGAFVAVPSNREAVVLAAKGLKAGSRNSASDQAHLDAAYDHLRALGAVGTQEEGSTTEDPADVKALTVKQAVEMLEGAGLAPDLATALQVLSRASGYAKPLDGTVRVHRDDADAGAATPDAAGADTAPAAAGKAAPADDEARQKIQAARMRFYNTLSGKD